MEFNASVFFKSRKGKIKVKDLVSIYGKLGIPHFQRGFLWGDAYKGYLLESLFSKTPCGTLIFWKSKGDSKGDSYGVPLLNDGPSPEAYIIDGQQRTRSLYEIFNEEKLKEEIIHINDRISNLGSTDSTSEENEEEYEEVNVDKSESNNIPEFKDGLWCINLLALNNISSYLTRRKKEYSLFLKRKVFISIKPEKSNKPEKSTESKYYAIKNYIPLSLLLCDNSDDKILKHLIGLSKPEFEAEVNKGIEKLRIQVKKILKESFIYSIIDSPYEEAIQTYIRINNSGIRVSPEEKVFAKLIKEYPDSNNHIKAIFDAIQPSRSGNTERDDYLKRSEEKSFGFKLIIKVFTQVCQYHLGVSTGSDAISYDVFNRVVFTSPDAKANYGYFWKETKDVLTKTKSILENILKIDDFRFLPDTTSLLPIFQLLITYRELRDDKYDELIGFLSLYYLTEYTMEFDMRDILAKVREIKDSKKNFQEIWALLLDKLFGKNPPRDFNDFRIKEFNKFNEFNEFVNRLSKKLEKSNSLEDRYVLLYYAILRLNKAVDFTLPPHKKKDNGQPKNEDNGQPVNEENGQPKKKNNKHSGEIIEKSIEPEKQHLIPYSWLKNEGEKSRRSSSIYNNIGNITYISAGVNGDLSAEPFNPKDDKSNILERHCLSETFNGGKALEYYKRIVRYGPNDKHFEANFNKFIKARRNEIISGEFGIVKALDKLFNSSKELLSNAIGEKRLEPTSPLLVKDPIADSIRSFTKDNNEIEDKLIFLSRGNVFEIQEPKSEDSLILKLKKKGAFKNIDIEISLDENSFELTTNIDELNCFTNKVYDFNQKDPIIKILQEVKDKLDDLKPKNKSGKATKKNRKVK